MANTVVTLEIPEGQVAKVVATLCKRGNLEATAANAKKQLIAEITRWVVEEQRREEQMPSYQQEPVRQEKQQDDALDIPTFLRNRQKRR
jgi:hypothetical protein